MVLRLAALAPGFGGEREGVPDARARVLCAPELAGDDWRSGCEGAVETVFGGCVSRSCCPG